MYKWITGPITTKSNFNGNFSISTTADTRLGAKFIRSDGQYSISHSANGIAVATSFDNSGFDTENYPTPSPIRFSALSKASSVSKLLRRNSGSNRAKNKPGATTVGDVLYENVLNFTSRASARTEAGVTLDAFRHLAFSAILTITGGRKFAKNIGDGHERDRTGFLNAPIASMIDLVNNAYGRSIGQEFINNGGTAESLGDPTNLSAFLNSILEKLNQTGYDVGSNVFNGSQQEVKELAETID